MDNPKRCDRVKRTYDPDKGVGTVLWVDTIFDPTHGNVPVAGIDWDSGAASIDRVENLTRVG